MVTSYTHDDSSMSTDMTDIFNCRDTESLRYNNHENRAPLDCEGSNGKGSNGKYETVTINEKSEEPLSPKSSRRFYRRKKYWLICSLITILIIITIVLVILFVVFPITAQFIMDNLGFQIYQADITFSEGKSSFSRREDYDMNNTFYLRMTSDLVNTGPLPAELTFHNPVNVYYNETFLGTVILPSAHISGGKGFLEANTSFSIYDTAYFAEFVKDMFAVPTFAWKIKGKVEIAVLGIAATVDLNKELYMQGMDGFPKVKLSNIQLPADAHEGGVQVELDVVLSSLSPVGVQLGATTMHIGYDGVHLGQVTSEDIKLKKGDNHLQLKGVLVPHADHKYLEKVSALLSNYVVGKSSLLFATGISCAPDGTNSVGWLSEGFQSVNLSANLGLDRPPFDIIRGMQMGYLDLAFNAGEPYAPVASAPAVVADFTNPFGFLFDITEVSQELTLGTNDNVTFAGVSFPYVPVQSDRATGKLQYAMTNVSITSLPYKETLFDDFIYALTASDFYSLQISGNVSAKAYTPIGNITLSGIPFDVQTFFHGLQFLNATPTVINDIDVIGGTSENLLLAINVTIENPSDFNIATGDVNLALLAHNEQLGTITLTDLKLQRGLNNITASSTFKPKVSQVGQNVLSTCVMGQNSDVTIAGFDRSTPISSLTKALGAIAISTSLPGLKQKLIHNANLTVNEDSFRSGVVRVQLSIVNPFSASLNITGVKALVTHHGMDVGNIDQGDVLSFNIDGHSTAVSPVLEMRMNIQPGVIGLLLRRLAIDARMDIRALDTLLSMGGFASQRSTDPNLFAGFNITNYFTQAMQSLAVDLQVSAGIKIGDYNDDLEFSQNDVAIQTDDTVSRLVPIIGQPIVQQIIDGVELNFEAIHLSDLSDAGFKVHLRSRVANMGPMIAELMFLEPLSVYWQGRELGNISIPTNIVQSNTEAQLDVFGNFTVSDVLLMGEFTTYMINQENFVWNIRTAGVSVTALGFTFTGINMNKFVTLDGCNAFRDAVLVNLFNLPSNHADGGITINADISINNPSQIGFSLPGAAFNIYYKDTELGPLATAGVITLAPKSLSNIKMAGRLLPQMNETGLSVVTEVFKNYLEAKDNVITMKGDSISGSDGQVNWLTSGFKTILIDNVILPGPRTPPELITSITIKNLHLDFTKEAYTPLAESRQVEAQLHSPFGFPLAVNQLGMSADAIYQGQIIASMEIPDLAATTSETGLVTTQFNDVPFTASYDDYPFFEAFTKLVVMQPAAKVDLKSSVNVVANTAVGDIKLDGLNFDVETSLDGLNNLDGKLDISSMTVTGGTNDYIIASVTALVNNPSQISVTVGDTVLDVFMNEFNAKIGDMSIKNLVLVPGANQLTAEVHVYSDDDRALGQLFSNYMTAALIPLTIKGTEQSSQISSLNPGLSALNLGATLTGYNDKIIVNALVYAGISVSEIFADTVVTLRNPLQTSISVHAINAVVTSRNKINEVFSVATVDYMLPNSLTINGGQQIDSGRLPVSIILNENNIVDVVELLFDPSPVIDLTLNATITVGDGFTTTSYYYQNQVPTSFKIDLGMILSQGVGSDALKESKIVSALPINVRRSLGLLTPPLPDLPTHVRPAVPGAVVGSSDLGDFDVTLDAYGATSDASIPHPESNNPQGPIIATEQPIDNTIAMKEAEAPRITSVTSPVPDNSILGWLLSF